MSERTFKSITAIVPISCSIRRIRFEFARSSRARMGKRAECAVNAARARCLRNQRNIFLKRARETSWNSHGISLGEVKPRVALILTAFARHAERKEKMRRLARFSHFPTQLACRLGFVPLALGATWCKRTAR